MCDRLNAWSIRYRQMKGGGVMNEIRLGVVESKFADIVWLNAPLTTKELVSICEKELNWKRTTTYTVLKKLCEKGLFKTENSIVGCLVSKEDFYSMQTECFVENTFEGSLPAFIAAFTKRKKLSEKEIKEIKAMINSIEEV